jgi:ATP-binding cassette subfamily B protein/ATP-binding cassette subfamily C protein
MIVLNVYLYEKPQITDENADQSLTAKDIQGD